MTTTELERPMLYILGALGVMRLVCVCGLVRQLALNPTKPRWQCSRCGVRYDIAPQQPKVVEITPPEKRRRRSKPNDLDAALSAQPYRRFR